MSSNNDCGDSHICGEFCWLFRRFAREYLPLKILFDVLAVVFFIGNVRDNCKWFLKRLSGRSWELFAIHFKLNSMLRLRISSRPGNKGTLQFYKFGSLYVWLVIARDNGYHKLAYRDMPNRANLNKTSPATRAYQEPPPGPRQQHRKFGQKIGNLNEYPDLPITPEEASAITNVEALTNGANSEDTEQSS
uniref:Uncharacterized protein n=1 Tax=Glossina austeni TaxID=7395 RepID=A0A1A9UWU3_GLOAU